MKTRFFLLYCILLCLSACNDGVFVEKLTLSVSGMSVPSDGSTVRVDLSTDDWEIASVATGNGTDWLYGNVYDLEGKQVAANSPLKGNGLVRMVSRHPVVDFVLERPCGNELQLTVKENPGREAFPLFVTVRNQYESHTLSFALEPSEPYCLDSITYRLDSYGVRPDLSYGPANSSVVLTNRESALPLRHEVYPYQKASGFVKFTVWGKGSLDLFGKEGILVHIPEPGQFFVFLSKDTYRLSTEYISVPIYEKLYTVVDTLTVPPFKNMLLQTEVEYEAKEISCELYATHPRTGGKKHITAICDRVDPVDYTLEQTIFAD